jgi:hypothetical protein
LFETRHGAGFVGFRVLPDRLRVRNENLRRARRRLSRLQSGYRRSEIGIPEITQSVRSWIGHLLHGDTWRLRKRVFASLAFTRSR